MILPETGDVTTPVDDPCQFNPAWRSIVAGYLVGVGVRSDGDFKSIAMSGSVTVTHEVTVEEELKKSRKAGKSKKNGKKKKERQSSKAARPIPPFDTNPEYRVFASDKWIQSLVYMCNDELDGHQLADENVPIKLASRWYSEYDNEAAMKKRIEPLLLTEIGMDIIALDLTGVKSAQPAIEAYERLYFNCRDDEFKLHPSMQLVQRFAMPWGPLKTFLRKWEEIDDDGFVVGDGRPLAKESDVWRAIAATMGYEALMYYWRWDGRAHGMKENSVRKMIELSWKASVGRLFSDLFTGNIAHEDVARVLASYTAQTKFLSDDRKEGGEGEDTTLALLAILQTAAPKMRELKAGSAGMITDNDIKERIAAQQAIDKTHIEDAGKGVEAEIIDAQISEAIDRE